MSYTICNVYSLPSTYAASTLRAQLYDSSNNAVGGEISTGFYKRVGSSTIFSHALMVPDNHVGWCDVYVNGAPSAIIACIPINPQEVENADAKVSLRPTAAQIDTQLSGTHGAGSWATATGFATPTNVTTAQAAIESAIAALNNLSTADVATALATYDGATQTDLTATQNAITAAIAALNNLSQAQAQSAATAALNAYDPPTKAELDSAVSPLATQTSVDALAGYVDTEISAIKAKTDNLPATPASTSDIPGTAAIATAIFAVAVETGHDLTTVLRAIYAAIRGRSVANDADDPTTITYYAPDNSTARVVHTLTDTERTVA